MSDAVIPNITPLTTAGIVKVSENDKIVVLPLGNGEPVK